MVNAEFLLSNVELFPHSASTTKKIHTKVNLFYFFADKADQHVKADH